MPNLDDRSVYPPLRLPYPSVVFSQIIAAIIAHLFFRGKSIIGLGGEDVTPGSWG